jgi:hypothetical protein
MEPKRSHILVAIADLRHAAVTELRKVALLAKAAGAHIELFHAISDFGFVPRSPGVSHKDLRDPKTAIAAERCRRLRQIARTKALQGLDRGAGQKHDRDANLQPAALSAAADRSRTARAAVKEDASGGRGMAGAEFTAVA